MKIAFLGAGSAFTTQEYYQSNMLLFAENGKKMLIDCGTDARFSVAEYKAANGDFGGIEAVYISHLHADHIGGMEWLAFSTFFGGKPKPELYIEEDLMNDLWEQSLRGGLGTIEGRAASLSDYFDCRPAPKNCSFAWEGIAFTMVRMPHVHCKAGIKYSRGLLLRQGGSSVFISTDARFMPGVIAELGGVASLMFHDCETSSARTNIHAHYEDLRTLPPGIKEKTWLYHYQPNPPYRPEDDGFRGFVKKGQIFQRGIDFP